MARNRDAILIWKLVGLAQTAIVTELETLLTNNGHELGRSATAAAVICGHKLNFKTEDEYSKSVALTTTLQPPRTDWVMKISQNPGWGKLWSLQSSYFRNRGIWPHTSVELWGSTCPYQFSHLWKVGELTVSRAEKLQTCFSLPVESSDPFTKWRVIDVE